MIADYESPERSVLLDAPRMYGLTQMHKHIPEMVKYTGLNKTPVFCPIVGDFYAGMEVVVSLSMKDAYAGIDEIKGIDQMYYGEGGLVHFNAEADEAGFMSAGAYAGRDDMEISVCGNNERILLVSRFDNLGKGASGAAIQNMNIVLGLKENEGLNI